MTHPMTTLANSIKETIRATLSAIPDAQRQQVTYIGAAIELLQAADFLVDAVESIALGATPGDPYVAQHLDYAKRKFGQGERTLAAALGECPLV